MYDPYIDGIQCLCIDTSVLSRGFRLYYHNGLSPRDCSTVWRSCANSTVYPFALILPGFFIFMRTWLSVYIPCPFHVGVPPVEAFGFSWSLSGP
ncbi:hypothetical protein BDV30DRAFT_58120 [Aspergillus minisclerotigenes]|uniref:Uncharacterized protein n=1 Tax=Aspergillus minisclerotigenes TaxID=656917 RepID=A0A5N6JBK8_9EURO|nr:hypothetical protein BDV30DRAFT_58120 [Aspergillus minisclerotigenes]